jgi:hypothetical protein
MPDSDRLAALALDAHVRIVDSRMVVSDYTNALLSTALFAVCVLHSGNIVWC